MSSNCEAFALKEGRLRVEATFLVKLNGECSCSSIDWMNCLEDEEKLPNMFSVPIP